jgi:hypothetical protein
MDKRDAVFDKDRDFTAARYSDLDGDGYILVVFVFKEFKLQN